jgi:D-psicose/D-tagatose/L-ribulose 3-epimerase
VDFFRSLGNHSKRVVICLEPNSRQYGCNYLTTVSEVETIVRKINHPRIQLMVDSGNAQMELDRFDLTTCFDILANVDVSAEKMRDFTNPCDFHYVLKRQLDQISYSHIVNLEMVVSNKDFELQLLRESIEHFVHIYSKPTRRIHTNYP